MALPPIHVAVDGVEDDTCQDDDADGRAVAKDPVKDANWAGPM